MDVQSAVSKISFSNVKYVHVIVLLVTCNIPCHPAFYSTSFVIHLHKKQYDMA